MLSSLYMYVYECMHVILYPVSMCVCVCVCVYGQFAIKKFNRIVDILPIRESNHFKAKHTPILLLWNVLK